MKGRRSAMTLIEMIVCLAIVAICFAALVRGIGSMGLLAAQEEEDAALVAAIETRLSALEAAPGGAIITVAGGVDGEVSIDEAVAAFAVPRFRGCPLALGASFAFE